MTDKLLVLDFDGSFEVGFKVRLEIRQGIHGQAQTKVSGKLAANPNLLVVYQQWQQRYASLESIFRNLAHSDPGQTTNSSNRLDAIKACQNAANLVEEELNRWLEQEPDFKLIRERLLQSGKNFRLWVQSDNVWLQRLPWERWDILQNSAAEVGLVLPEYDTAERQYPARDRVKILGVLGHAPDLSNLSNDKEIINQLVTKKGAEITWLDAPLPAILTESLRTGGWDMLIYSGHSASTEDGKRCEIQFTAEYWLEIPDFRNALKEATQNGLRLAIFNSCDGIGLAHQLASDRDITLPHLVLMRERLPDAVSPIFLNQFLQAFIDGKSLYAAVQQAREVLHDSHEKKYPCASWLPVVYPNPTEETPTWRSLNARFAKRQKLFSFGKVFATGLVVALAVVGVRGMGGLASLELAHYDFMMQNRVFTKEQADNIIIITINQEDVEYQKTKGMFQQKEKENTLSKKALLELLKKFEKNKPKVIGLDVALSREVDSLDLTEQLKKTTNLIGVCYDDGKQFFPAPLGLNNKQVGFPHFSPDMADNKVRQFAYMAELKKNSKCLKNERNQSSVSESKGKESLVPSFALLIVKYYWEETPFEDRIDIDKFAKGQLKIQSNNSLIEDKEPVVTTYGEKFYRSFLNYLPTSNNAMLDEIAPKESLRNIFSFSNDDLKKLENKIVLIGEVTPEEDDHLTIMNRDLNHETPGIYIHAHTIKHFLDVLKSKRPGISFWSSEFETLWIILWSIFGGFMGWIFRRHIFFLGGSMIVVIMPVFSGFLLFNTLALWVPLFPPVIGMLTSAGIVLVVMKKNQPHV